jgi:hypothetical protein
VARAALLQSEDPLVKAYTACILANIAFLAPGQEKVLEAHGVKPLVKLLKAKDADKKITLHSTAAVQNLTYKNTACCQQVLEEGGGLDGVHFLTLSSISPHASAAHCATATISLGSKRTPSPSVLSVTK